MSASLDRSQVIIFLKDVPYGSQRAANALRLCEKLLDEGQQVTIVLEGDSVSLGKKAGRLQRGFVSMEGAFAEIISRGAKVMTSSSCTLARGFSESDLLDGVELTKELDIKVWIEEGIEVLMF
jgi:sulfur relay (sulfurtransferase) complex TusBCD TusD component (DsrE family)